MICPLAWRSLITFVYVCLSATTHLLFLLWNQKDRFLFFIWLFFTDLLIQLSAGSFPKCQTIPLIPPFASDNTFLHYFILLLILSCTLNTQNWTTTIMLSVFFLPVLLSFPTCLFGLVSWNAFSFLLFFFSSLSSLSLVLLPVACQTPSVVQCPLLSTSHTRLPSPLSPL